ncbi:MAG: hypothetical protein U9R34_03975 [Nanoarchaeota archaeon]|nr:hypothetical protein [Nanoarchaeota archaeon]
MPPPYKDQNLELEQLIKDSSDEFSKIYNNDGFILENDLFSLEYVCSDITGYNRLYIDIFTNSFIRIEGGMDPEDRSMNGFYASHLYVLGSGSLCDDDYVLAEAERPHSLNMEDINENHVVNNIVKNLQDFAKESKKDILIEPNEEWFENAANLFWTVGLKCGLYDAYDNWVSQYRKQEGSEKIS